MWRRWGIESGHGDLLWGYGLAGPPTSYKYGEPVTTLSLVVSSNRALKSIDFYTSGNYPVGRTVIRPVREVEDGATDSKNHATGRGGGDRTRPERRPCCHLRRAKPIPGCEEQKIARACACLTALIAGTRGQLIRDHANKLLTGAKNTSCSLPNLSDTPGSCDTSAENCRRGHAVSFDHIQLNMSFAGFRIVIVMDSTYHTTYPGRTRCCQRSRFDLDCRSQIRNT